MEFNGALSNMPSDVKTITLDCSDVDYIDSAGIGLLVMAYKKLNEKNVKIVITNLKDAPREILSLANIQKLIECK